jgi:di/tricarboxylate transporter
VIASIAQFIPAAMLLSPVPAAVGLLIYYFVQRQKHPQVQMSFGGYMGAVLAWALAAAVTTAIAIFMLSIAYNSGNGPLAIFVFGPLAFAIGAVVGALLWRRKVVKPSPSLHPDARQ